MNVSLRYKRIENKIVLINRMVSLWHTLIKISQIERVSSWREEACWRGRHIGTKFRKLSSEKEEIKTEKRVQNLHKCNSNSALRPVPSISIPLIRNERGNQRETSDCTIPRISIRIPPIVPFTVDSIGCLAEFPRLRNRGGRGGGREGNVRRMKIHRLLSSWLASLLQKSAPRRLIARLARFVSPGSERETFWDMVLVTCNS